MTKQEIKRRAAAAQIAGTAAFKNDVNAACLDPNMTPLIKGCKVGEGEPILKAWCKGWALADLNG